MLSDNYLTEQELRCLADAVYELNKVHDCISHTLTFDLDGLKIYDTNGDVVAVLGFNDKKRLVARVDLSD